MVKPVVDKPVYPPIVVGIWRGRYLKFRGQQFVLLAAPTRSGKGVGIVIPNLLSYDHSVVVLDIKQENYTVTAGFRAAHGQDVYLWNPFAEDFRTARYNPLSAISPGVFRVGDILAIGYALYPAGGHDDFWKDQARNLFLALTLFLCELRDARLNRTMEEVPDYPVTIGEVLRQSSGKGQPVKLYLQQAIAIYGEALSGACVDAMYRFLANDDKVLASILATFNAPLTIWANPIVDAATSANDFDLRDVRRKKMTVYIGITPDHLSEAALLVNLMFSQLVNLNTKELPQDNPELRYQCLLLMDEFTSIGKVAIIAKAVSYMAGYNLRLMPIIQSIAQLESVYGREDARTFATNHALQILYPPREQKDANEYSEMLGYLTEKSTSVSRSRGWSSRGAAPGESISDQRRALLLPQELKELRQDREIILLENTKPILAQKIIYWKDPAFTSRLLDAPAVRLIDIAGYQARVEHRVRELRLDEIDVDALRLKNMPVEHLEVLNGWDGRDLPANLDDISEQEASEYVNRHFTLIGVPQVIVERASRSIDDVLAGSTIEAPPAPVSDEEAQEAVAGMFSSLASETDEVHGRVGLPETDWSTSRPPEWDAMSLDGPDDAQPNFQPAAQPDSMWPVALVGADAVAGKGRGKAAKRASRSSGASSGRGSGGTRARSDRAADGMSKSRREGSRRKAVSVIPVRD